MQDRGKTAHSFRPHIIVKFKDDIKLSDKGTINLEELRPGLWDDIVREFPGISIEKLFTSVEPARIKELQNEAIRNDRNYKPTNLLSYFVVYFPPQINPLLLVKKLLSLDIVEKAYEILEEYEEPSSVNPENNLPGYPHQGYLGPAPHGIDVEFAWNQPGGDGLHQHLIDLERGWKGVHEDLVCRPYNVYGTNLDSSNHHGTAVLGIICACDNDRGCIGIVPNISSLDLVSHHSVPLSDAILDAISHLKFGDVLLIEVQIPGTQLPVESQPDVFVVIRLASALGIVVIECAGNAGEDLDVNPQTQHLSRTNPNFDSGAIMVGAATSTVPHQRSDSTMQPCNYGSRIDCYAWGQNVWTTWWPRPADPPNMFYFSCFDATSAAGAIIASAALSLQGMAEQTLGRRLGPGEMRTFLADPTTGTPAYHNSVQDPKLGYMPNLRAIVIQDLACVYIRDFVGDTGYPHNGTISASPDIIVRPNAVANPQASFGQGSGTENSNSLGSSITMGQDNYIYVRVNNIGASTATNVVAHVYWSEVASLITPDMWNKIGSVQIPNVASGILTVSNALQWASQNIPAAGHYCFICIIGSSGAPPPNPANFRNFDYYCRFIRENNKVTWRNFNIISNVGLLSGELAGFVIANFLVVGAHDKDREMELEFSPQLPIGAKVSIEMPTKLAKLIDTDLMGIDPNLIEYDEHKRIARIPLNANYSRQTIIKGALPAKEHFSIKLYVYIPEEFRHKDHTVSVSQKYKSLEVGGVTWKLVPMIEKS